MDDFDSITGVIAVIGTYSTSVTTREGIVVDGWGEIRVRAGAGRAVILEVEESISGTIISAEIDAFRPRRARTNLDVERLRGALDSAARIEGISDPFPEPQ